MEEPQKNSGDALHSALAEVEAEGVKDFSEYMEVSRDFGTVSEAEQKELSNTEKALQKIQEGEKEYLQEFEKFYSAIPLHPPKSQETYDLLINPSAFYKTLMDWGGEAANKLHGNIQMFLSNTDSKTQQVARQRIITSYWNFYEAVIENITGAMPDALLFMMRYGILISSLVSKEVLSVIANIDIKAANETTFYYVDEWLSAVSSGVLTPTVLNEQGPQNVGANLVAMKQKKDNIQRQQEQKISACQGLNSEMGQVFDQAKAILDKLEHMRKNSDFDFAAPYTSTELQEFKNIHEVLRSIVGKNSQLEVEYNSVLYNKKNLDSLSEEVAALEAKADSSQSNEPQIHKSLIVDELTVVRQMCKLCVGARGNHFPLLYKSYFSSPFKNMGYREQAVQVFKEIESIDFTLFQRIVKSNVMRNAPIVLLVPCYGSRGFCWEPFERGQRNTSSSKLVVPMYSRDLYTAVVYAVGDYRWQIAKELAGQFWMKEGLTGWYFQWFDSNIKKGDIKEKFIEDYILWMKWEQKGVQKLSKEVREIFWRFIPFTRKVKKTLVKMGPVYRELSKKEQNRAVSEMM